MHCLLRIFVNQNIELMKEVNWISLSPFKIIFVCNKVNVLVFIQKQGATGNSCVWKAFPVLTVWAPSARLPSWIACWNQVCCSRKWKISRRLLRGEHSRVDFPCNDTGGDICHLQRWPFSPSSNTYYPEKRTQLKGETKLSHQPGTLFSDSQLVYSSFSNMKCCRSFELFLLPFFRVQNSKARIKSAITLLSNFLHLLKVYCT